eukprot:12920183-Prorocentrum_lima.AAC.1
MWHTPHTTLPRQTSLARVGSAFGLARSKSSPSSGAVHARHVALVCAVGRRRCRCAICVQNRSHVVTS